MTASQAWSAKDTGKPKSRSITAIVLAKGDSSQLDRCLKSAAPAADQVLVIDTRRSPETLETAKSQGAAIVSLKWDGDFSQLRNRAMEEATGDWILSLSADEWLAEETPEILRGQIEKPTAAGFLLPVWQELGRVGSDDCLVRYSLRFFQKTDGIKYSGIVSESPVESIEAAGGELVPLATAGIRSSEYIRRAGSPGWDIALKTHLLKKQLQETPDDTNLLFHLGLEFFALGDYLSAEQYLRRCAKALTGNERYASAVFSLLAICLRELGLPDKAIQVAARALKQGLECVELVFASAWGHLAQRDYPMAAREFRRTLELSSNPPFSMVQDPSITRFRAQMGLALALVESGHPEKALPHALKAVRGCPNKPEPLVLLGCTHHFMGDRSKALLRFEQALAADPGHPDALDLCAALYQEMGLQDKALEMVERSLQRDPKSPRLLACRADALAAMGRSEEAQKTLDEALFYGENSSDIQCEAGRIFGILGKQKESIECFEKAIRLQPSDPSPYFGAADMLYKMGQYQSSAELYRCALQVNPSDAEGWASRGNACIRSGKPKEAILCWEKALELDPKLESADCNLRMIRQRLARPV